MWALQNKRAINIIADDINPSNVDTNKFPFPLKLLPFELLFHRGRVHVAGLEIKTHKLLIFVVDKTFTLQLTNETFNRKKNISIYNSQVNMRFGISEPAADKTYNIKIEFADAYALSMMSFYWHKTAQWKQLKNGNYMLQMQCGIGRELIGFLAAGLDKIKVHQPKLLKDLLIKKYKDTLGLYDGKAPDEERANEDY